MFKGETHRLICFFILIGDFNTQARSFVCYLNEYGMISSMNRKGDCWDNAPAESFFAPLKRERMHRMYFRKTEEVKKDLFWYIEIFYNQIRLHSSMGYLNPAMFENNNAS